MNKTKWILIFLIFMLVSTSCGTPAKKPMQPTKEKTTLPKIPDKISRGYNKEPVLKVYITQTGKIETMPLEQYVMGTVAGEIKNDWPLEALKAQAILARSYVLNFVNNEKSKYTDADISTDFEEAQAWNPSNINSNIKKAVNDTRGLVAVYDGKYIEAWFHSDAAGRTALAKEGLNYKKSEPPYTESVKSDDIKVAPPNIRNWSYTFTKQEVLSALNKMGIEISDFKTVKIGAKGISGRTVLLDFDKIPVNAPDFRIAIGSEKMKSTMLDSVKYDGSNLTIKGRGFGHGVGMSQWGAYQMAKNGAKASDIIMHYFKNINIVKLWK
ncbi:SpoIID/LytB domain-containing protein [Thermoanaerobacterium sp. R66]|uniref:SpoIID/LytB domain-containing protein n=1 Tax=Thermoanaerobacterium sp. R66 TaxID=2742479 RepID=UPI0023807E0B|nr:SpoIID/LytB domain-containing protein [Thermoanaerobacterium sp. R66]MDE4543249.1 SpoIID/LytB domain-containing protein [Thermoanaerobacterium sp. R66]